MQDIIYKKTTNGKYIGKILSINDIEKFYTVKENKKSLLGIEYERLSLDKNTLQNAKYEFVSKIIDEFAKISSWNLIYDDTNIIGAKDNEFNSISLEPGCQMEISLKPMDKISDIYNKMSEIIDLLDKIAEKHNVFFLGYGISPKSDVNDIDLLNKKRYKIMNNYLPYCKNGELSPSMMRKTAGIQINVDYSDKIDAYNKLKFFNLIMPFISALCANSPIENNKLTGLKSNRTNIWLHTGENRCNIFYKNIFNNSFERIFKSYIDEVIKVPMIYIIKDGKNIPINGEINFLQYMQNGWNNYSATYDDYILHQSLCFPDVRLKNYIEIRNHDSNNLDVAIALCAFYKGIVKSKMADLLEKFDYLKISNIEKINQQLIAKGLDVNIILKKTGWDIVSELFKISQSNLDTVEKQYLEPINVIINSKKTFSDMIIEKNIQNSSALIDFLL